MTSDFLAKQSVLMLILLVAGLAGPDWTTLLADMTFWPLVELQEDPVSKELILESGSNFAAVSAAAVG